MEIDAVLTNWTWDSINLLGQATPQIPPGRDDDGILLAGVLASIGWIIVNAPLVRALRIYDSRLVFPQIFGHAPNQFLFLLVFYPVATFCTVIGWMKLSVLADNSDSLGVLGVLVAAWPLLLLTGVICCVIAAILDYRETVPDFDQLTGQHAARAVASERTVAEFLAREVDRGKRTSRRLSLLNAASTRIATPEKRAEILGNAIVQADELNMDSQQKAAEMAAAYLMVISTPSEEEKRQVCDLVQRVLNGVELVAALIGAFMLFFGAAIALWARVQLHRFNASDDLAAFRGVVAPFVVATLLYGTFAVFRAYNRAEIHEVTGLYPAGIKGEVFTTLLVMAVSILLAYAYFPGVASIPMITAVLSAAVTTVGWIVVKIRHQELRGVIGSGATWGNTFFVVVISVMLLAGVGIGMMVESRV